MRVFVEAHRRVTISRFLGREEAFQAEIADISEGQIPYAPDLIFKAIVLFEKYAAARQIRMRQTWPTLRQTRDPGRTADMIATYLTFRSAASRACWRPLTLLRDLKGSMPYWRANLEVSRQARRLVPISVDIVLPLRRAPDPVRNPRQSGHRFRRKAAIDSDRKRQPNPIEGGHPVDRVRRGALSAI